MASLDSSPGRQGAMPEERPHKSSELGTAVPNLAPAEVQALVAHLYGMEVGVNALAGERDQNCALESSDGVRYVFKISNPSEPVSLVDFQIAAIEHIARTSPSQPVPRVSRIWMPSR